MHAAVILELFPFLFNQQVQIELQSILIEISIFPIAYIIWNVTCTFFHKEIDLIMFAAPLISILT